jgi:1L-myo-inositol 1-phosphate cytidylyltransferase
MKAVIIAAGMGSRLWSRNDRTPKTLLPFGGGTILSEIAQRLADAGITELVLVIGFQKERILDALEKTPLSLPATFVDNLLWERGNGISVYQVKDVVGDEPFLLSMSDHLVAVPALRKIVRNPNRVSLLLVDPYFREIFDIDDATKVVTEGDRIIEIGKELSSYNGVDCGIFRLERDFFAAVESALGKGVESINGAVTELIARNRMRAVLIEQPRQWLDIDTPDAYEHAQDLLRRGLL